jgi:hypothetical protein
LVHQIYSMIRYSIDRISVRFAKIRHSVIRWSFKYSVIRWFEDSMIRRFDVHTPNHRITEYIRLFEYHRISAVQPWTPSRSAVN